MKFAHIIALFTQYIVLNLKIKLEYKANFALMLFFGSFSSIIVFLFLELLFSSIHQIQGWTKWEIVLMFALVYFTEGVSSIAFDGMWRINRLVNMDDIDRFLVRPVSPIIQILTCDTSVTGIGTMMSSILLFSLALNQTHIIWTADKVLFMPIFLISAITIRTSISFSANCSGFWLTSFYSTFPFIVYNMRDFAKYLSPFYERPIQFFITVILPYAFIAYIPAVYLFNKETWGAWAWLMPIIALGCILVARVVFYSGLRRYYSSGESLS